VRLHEKEGKREEKILGNSWHAGVQGEALSQSKGEQCFQNRKGTLHEPLYLRGETGDKTKDVRR